MAVGGIGFVRRIARIAILASLLVAAAATPFGLWHPDPDVRAQLVGDDGELLPPEREYLSAQESISCPSADSKLEMTSALQNPPTSTSTGPFSDGDALTRFLVNEYPHLTVAQFSRRFTDGTASVYTATQAIGEEAGRLGAAAYVVKWGNSWTVTGLTACNSVIDINEGED